MREVALSTLRLRVRRAVDSEGATSRFSDAELNDYINESLAELYELIRSAFGQDYYRKVYSFTTGGNSATYNLPSDFLALISVDVPLGGNLVLTARPFMENERNKFKFFPFGAWTMHQPIYYRLTGATDGTGATAQTISFIPTPTGTYTVNVNYVPVPPVLSADGDTFDGVAGWEEYAVADAAIKCALKNQQFDLMQALEGRKAQIMARIEKMAAEHDGGAPERVHDVTTDQEAFDW